MRAAPIPASAEIEQAVQLGLDVLHERGPLPPFDPGQVDRDAPHKTLGRSGRDVGSDRDRRLARVGQRPERETRPDGAISDRAHSPNPQVLCIVSGVNSMKLLVR